MKHPRAALASVATWLGIELDAAQVGLLVSYADWLVTEAATSGAIGPAEPDRIWDRHVLDALTFGHGLAGAASVIDVGTGAGLPGIPLAIAFPHTEVTLLDRSTSRTDALHRIARILGIPVRVVTADVRDHDGRYARVKNAWNRQTSNRPSCPAARCLSAWKFGIRRTISRPGHLVGLGSARRTR